MTAADVSVRPILSADLPEVAAFLAEHFPPDSAADDWVEAWREINGRPESDAPNHGMAIWSSGRVVGAYCAIYSKRWIRGRAERFCNLAVWCVLPAYRAASVRMLRAILAQSGYHFTDLAPTPTVQRLNLRLGFRYLPSGAHLKFNLPWPVRSRGIRVSDDPRLIERALSSETRRYYDDHAGCRWPRHAVITKGDASCYVQWRFEKRKHVRAFAVVQYVSNPALFHAAQANLAGHLARRGAAFMLVDDRVAAGPLKRSIMVGRRPRKMFRSPTLGAGEIDYLYSEITAAP